MPDAPSSPRTNAVSAVRRLLLRFRYVISVVTLVALAVPCALGAGAGPVLRMMGSLDEHVCKCGMKPGTCGCPECARLEARRRADRAPTPTPALRRDCNEGEPAMPGGAPMPSGVLPPAAIALLRAPAGRRVPFTDARASTPRRDLEPPTPPPRIASV